ncbi:MAG: SH3 domain-containing protein [Chloroflexi bacterium]|nr:SH3 domain-containing protein [Chloroflexota bacterium]
MKRSWSIVLLIALVLTAVMPMGTALAQDGDDIALQQGTVVADVLAIRAETDIAAEVLGTVDGGTVVDVLEVGDVWTLVRYEGTEGWAFTDDLQIGPAKVNLEGVVTGDADVNLLDGPAEDANTVTTVAPDTRLGVLELNEPYAFVYTGSNVGWLPLENLTLSQDASYPNTLLMDMAVASTGSEVAVRTEPSLSGEVAFTLDADSAVDVLVESEDGLFAYVWDGTQGGWAFTSNLSITQERAPGVAFVTENRLNFRDFPVTTDNTNILEQLPTGAEVIVLEIQTVDGTFVNVQYQGQQGWVAYEFLDTELDLEGAPDITATQLLTIADIAIADENFSTLVDAVLAASPNILETLSGPGPITVFAPTNDAFAAAPPEVLDVVLSNSLYTTSTLLAHVTPGALTLEELSDGQEIPTASALVTLTVSVSGDTITFQVNGANSATATGTVVPAANGNIIVIDSVLVPPQILNAATGGEEEAPAEDEAAEE